MSHPLHRGPLLHTMVTAAGRRTRLQCSGCFSINEYILLNKRMYHGQFRWTRFMINTRTRIHYEHLIWTRILDELKKWTGILNEPKKWTGILDEPRKWTWINIDLFAVTRQPISECWLRRRPSPISRRPTRSSLLQEITVIQRISWWSRFFACTSYVYKVLLSACLLPSPLDEGFYFELLSSLFFSHVFYC